MNFLLVLLRNGVNYDSWASSYSKHVRGVGLPIHYVLHNPLFSIISGAQLSHIILSLHLYNNYYDYKKIYINHMAKRQANGATNSLDKKFEIHTDTFVVVTTFNGHLLENTMAIIQQKKGYACSLIKINNFWSCYRRRRKEHSWDRCAYVKQKVQ